MGSKILHARYSLSVRSLMLDTRYSIVLNHQMLELARCSINLKKHMLELARCSINMMDAHPYKSLWLGWKLLKKLSGIPDTL